MLLHTRLSGCLANCLLYYLPVSLLISEVTNLNINLKGITAKLTHTIGNSLGGPEGGGGGGRNIICSYSLYSISRYGICEEELGQIRTYREVYTCIHKLT